MEFLRLLCSTLLSGMKLCRVFSVMSHAPARLARELPNFTR
jgi:hypothetical protein